MNLLSRLFLPAASLLLAGCISLGGSPVEKTLYAPNPRIETDPDWPRVPLSLAIGEPLAGSLLDSRRIVVRPEPARLAVYAGALWADEAPLLVQSLLVRHFADSGRFAAVSRPTGTFAADLLLELELRHFEAVYADGALLPEVRIELQATLIDAQAQRVLASRVLRSVQASEGKALPAVMAAFEAALAANSRELLPWVLAEAGGAAALKPPQPR